MKEEFLYYIWKYRLFNKNIYTSDGESLQIIKSGERNHDSGPDFFNAKIKIGKTIWAGNVEIHINSSDWYKHNHQEDKAYDNIILHVVYQNELSIFRKSGEKIPTIELKNTFDIKLLDRYYDFMSSKTWIPCEKLISFTDKFIVFSWLESLLIERLEKRSLQIISSLMNNKNNWEQTFYEHLAMNFGFKLNSEAFVMLARSLPIKYLLKHKDNNFQVEAMLFGQAGFLKGQFIETYPFELKKEYEFLQKKYSLKPIDTHIWKFLRLRPSNFPTIRISQFASLICKSSSLFSKILENKNIVDTSNIFEISTSRYWDNHYTFKKLSAKKTQKIIGNNTRDLLIINTIVPFLFTYGKIKKNEKYIEKALKFLEETKGEINSITKKWKTLSLNTSTAYHTQALLELKNNYCDQKICLDCRIGDFLLKNS
ncbi:MAG: DUF2851 family protein [Bacteroidales bacterium]|nr:DUF2851 family protein [Bacteroidales bacterium]